MPEEFVVDQPSLLLRTQGGFANRLRAIASAALWAEDLGRKLTIYWPVEPGHMPCPLEQILIPSSIPYLCCIHAGYLSKAHQILSVADMESFVQHFGHQNELRIESYAEFHPDLVNRTPRGLGMLRNIRIQPNIEHHADVSWAKEGGRSHWIAVHYRGTDHRKCLEASPLTAFIREMEAQKRAEPDVEFLLCTDEHDASHVLKKHFGSEVVHVPIMVRGRREPAQQLLGVVDWLLLQKCFRVLASKGSSFSEMAVARSGGDLRVVTLEQ